MTRNQTIWGSPVQLLYRLAGQWSLSRTIDGQDPVKSPLRGSMRGSAVWTPINSGAMAYREEGLLRLNDGAEMQAERDYIYGLHEDGFDVFFKEFPPRLFQHVALGPDADGGLFGNAEHPCGEDIYRSSYRFGRDGNFTICHVVSGPRKNYAMRTDYTRA
jgi:hypothetical protein